MRFVLTFLWSGIMALMFGAGAIAFYTFLQDVGRVGDVSPLAYAFLGLLGLGALGALAGLISGRFLLATTLAILGVTAFAAFGYYELAADIRQSERVFRDVEGREWIALIPLALLAIGSAGFAVWDLDASRAARESQRDKLSTGQASS